MITMTRTLLIGLASLLCAQACIPDELPDDPDTGTPAPSNKPDLYVRSLAFNPPIPIEHQPVSVTLSVGNQGGAPLRSDAQVQLFGGENFQPPASCSWTIAAGALDAGRQTTLTCSFSYPSWYPILRAKVVLDAANAVDEDSAGEANNTFLQEISVDPTPAPDLDLKSLTFDHQPVQGQPLNVSVTVQNVGKLPVPAVSHVVRWYGGEAFPTPGCEWTLGALAVNAETTVTCQYAGYQSWYGNINTMVVLDATNQVNEGTYIAENNTFKFPISVSQP